MHVIVLHNARATLHKVYTRRPSCLSSASHPLDAASMKYGNLQHTISSRLCEWCDWASMRYAARCLSAGTRHRVNVPRNGHVPGASYSAQSQSHTRVRRAEQCRTRVRFHKKQGSHASFNSYPIYTTSRTHSNSLNEW